MPRAPIVSVFAIAIAAFASAGWSQGKPPSPTQVKGGWVPPGTPGSPIDGTIFHAQVLLDAAGFPGGTIDGKKGMSFQKAIEGLQEAKGLDINGELDGPTRAGLLSQNRPSTIMVKLDRAQVSGPFVYPFPKKPEDQAKLDFLGYRNMLEEVAEEYHTTPRAIVALNGPTALIGPGQTLRLPNVVPAARDYSGLKQEYARWMQLLNVDSGTIKGDHVVISKHKGVLQVLDADDKLVAQFPVTIGSSHDPLPIGDWKVTTYSYLPPFNYQPDLFWDVSDDKAAQKLPPGPNGPVGVAWLDLTKEHYGIHGTAEPQTIGRTESHGCIRLSNWNVLRLSRMLKPGFKAQFTA